MLQPALKKTRKSKKVVRRLTETSIPTYGTGQAAFFDFLSFFHSQPSPARR
jgi:hypothetical protein